MARRVNKVTPEDQGHDSNAVTIEEAGNVTPVADPGPDDAPVPIPIPVIPAKAISFQKSGPMLRGEKGPRVVALQTALEKHSYLLPGSKKADGTLDGICGPELLNATYNYAVERHFGYHDDEWPSIPEDIIVQALSDQPLYGRGVDVAKYQPVIDYARLKAKGVSFLIAKATDIGHESQNSFTDALFGTHWAGATAARIPFGAYMFWHPALDPEKQANYFIKQTAKYYQPGDICPVIDVERNDKLSSKEVNLRLQKVINVLTAHFGKAPIIYTSRRVCLEQGITVGGECPVWLAYYVGSRDIDEGPKKNMQPTFRVGPPLPSQWKDWAIWQSGYASKLDGVREGDETDRDLIKCPLSDLLL